MDIKNTIEKYIPYNGQEEKDKQTLIKYIDSFEDILTRNNEFAHFTSSAWVVNKGKTKVLMIYHNIYNSWTWTGGHADGNSNFLEVAMKEVKEETGIKSLKPICEDIFAIDILSVWGHIKKGKYLSAHVHLNITYLLEADEHEKLIIKEDENSGVKWVPIDEVTKYSTEKLMHNVYLKLIDKMKLVKK